MSAIPEANRSLLALPRAGQYQLIYADPPWAYKNQRTRAAANKHYPVMSANQMSYLAVDKLAAPDCALVMWHVPTQPEEALMLVKEWGFRLVTMKLFTWVKTNPIAGTPFMGLGNYTRANSEDCLLAVRGRCPTVQARDVRQIITAPRQEHSRKPDEALRRIDRLFGDVARVELFARRAAPGWDCWGNELESEVAAA